ncbi:Uu.00g017560.m01.CDS01 [Anthostomella pinea]|uniref:THO complex subunit 2 n=1 Tax=Anthostomella pinea TaxID=933095 RepID=A0AAI8YND9_9PEZI|nr:Uu.00g017560.m01.CDS01 [Anthostomella pinea]
MPPKRKRNERASEAGGNRPAPHRPFDTALGQHDREFQDGSPSQSRRGPGGGRNTRRNPDRRDSSGSQLGPGSSNRVPASPSVARPPSSSSQAPVVAMPATPSAPPPSQPRAAISSNYNYTVLTEARFSAWQQSGRQEVIEHGITSRSDEDVEEISTISQEFTRAVLEHRLNPLDAGGCMKQILGPETERTDDSEFAFDAQTLFLDIISVFIESENGRPSTQLRDFITATELSPKLLREVLDATALQHLGLIRDNFVKLGIRYATNQLYRQANYNLLREESEGYSKLAAELYRTPYHTQGPKSQDFVLVEACWERVKALIGTFDLDVGRVLDVVIDVFSATMLRNIQFFTRFLRVSSWWPHNQVVHAEKVFAGGLPNWALPSGGLDLGDFDAELAERAHERDLAFWDRAREIHLDAFFELGGRRVADADLQRLVEATSESSNLNIDSSLEWMRSTKTLPPSGNRVAAQLLGFKFRFYASDARDRSETLPANLYYLAAFLIKIGFISLPDLYTHLWPADEDMDKLRKRREDDLAEKERNARQGNEPNALLMAGALSDDTVPTSRSRDAAAAKSDAKDQEAGAKQQDDETSLPEPKEAHKADLVSHLLVVGALPEALFILGQFPWLPDAYPEEIYPAVNRILLHSISKVYQDARPVELRTTKSTLLRPEAAQDQAGIPKGKLRLVDGTPIRVLKWPHPDGISKGTLYRFYLDSWADNVPVCQTVDDVFTLCSTLLNVSGVNIGRDPTLVKKLAAIGVKSLVEDQSAENTARWQDLLRRVLVPSLSLTTANVDTVVAVWDLLKQFPTPVRYSIYAECYEGQITRVPAMAHAFKNARRDTLATLKRLALQNVPSSAKRLAKIALSSPGIVCKVALDQIEAYSNLIEAFVECTKYFTELGHDVLVWSLLSSLGGKQRSRTQEISILLTSKWLQALSRFSGKVFRRYPNMDVTPVLQYVNDQVAQGNSTDLVILRELITSMAGIVSDIDFTDVQLSALSGGELLRRRTLISLGDKRYDSGKSASRFMKALVHTNIASQLLTNMAQYRQSAIYRLPENETHIKYLATVVDDSQQALVQYVELLRSNLTPEDFDARMPSVPQLMTDFGLDANLAFLIGRASLTYYMTGSDDEGQAKQPLDADGDSNMIADTEAGPTATASSEDSEDRMQVENPDASGGSSEKTTSSFANHQKPDRLMNVLSPIVDAVRTLLPADVWNKLSPEFFVLFWSLQTGDLDVPKASYAPLLEAYTKERDQLKRSGINKMGGENRNESKITAVEQLMEPYSKELTNSMQRAGKTRLLMRRQSSAWFSSSAKTDLITDTLIEECLLPRILLSPGDADFCHRMIIFLHLERVPNFKIANLYDRFFNVNRLRSMIFGCTVREAEFLGRFIKITLGDLARWHQSKEEYEKDQQGTLGFATAFDDNGKPVSFMEHDKFRDLLWTWHRNLSTALRSCLGGTEWMHIRNAITILKAGLEYFPAVDFMGRQFLQSLGKIAEREAASKNGAEDGHSHRVDLAVTANTATSALKKYSSKWVMVQAFRVNTTGDTAEEKKAAESGEQTQSSHLRANAPEFKPRTTSGSTRTRTNVDEEDGEVKDKATSAITQSTGAARRDVSQVRSMHTPQKQDPRSASTRSSATKSTPPAAAPAPGLRQEQIRTSSLTPGPGLPSRPEVPFPGHFTHDHLGQIKITPNREQRDSREPRETREPRDSLGSRDPNLRDSRDTRDPRDPRPFRPLEDSRSNRARDHSTPDRRAVESVPREPSRSERDRQPPRSDAPRRIEPTPTDRDVRPSRERTVPPSGTGRGTETHRAQRETPAAPKPMPPPPPAPQPETPGPTVNPERAWLIQSDRPEDRSNPVNPARAALINDGRPVGRPIREDSRDRNSPRPTSPRRSDRPDSRTGDSSREERPGRPHRVDHAAARDHRNEPQPASASKGGRVSDNEGDRVMTDRPRDSAALQGPLPASRGEPDHGRLAMQDPEYGRLSSITSITDMGNPPEGPRGRGRNAPRTTVNTQTPRPDARFHTNEPHRQPSPDRHHPPTGPASSRPRRSQPGGQHNTVAAISPVNAGPPPAGIHPERLRQLNVVPGAAPTPTQGSHSASTPSPVSVHPDRMLHIVPPSSSSAGTSYQGGRSMPPLQTPERPLHVASSNHRQSSGSHPITPGPDNSPISAPTGPAAAKDRARTGGRRQLSAINDTLQGSRSLRSTNSRSNMAGSDAQVLTGVSPISTSGDEEDMIMPNVPRVFPVIAAGIAVRTEIRDQKIFALATHVTVEMEAAIDKKTTVVMGDEGAVDHGTSVGANPVVDRMIIIVAGSAKVARTFRRDRMKSGRDARVGVKRFCSHDL